MKAIWQFQLTLKNHGNMPCGFSASEKQTYRAYHKIVFGTQWYPTTKWCWLYLKNSPLLPYLTSNKPSNKKERTESREGAYFVGIPRLTSIIITDN